MSRRLSNVTVVLRPLTPQARRSADRTFSHMPFSLRSSDVKVVLRRSDATVVLRRSAIASARPPPSRKPQLLRRSTVNFAPRGQAVQLVQKSLGRRGTEPSASPAQPHLPFLRPCAPSSTSGERNGLLAAVESVFGNENRMCCRSAKRAGPAEHARFESRFEFREVVRPGML